MSVGGFVCFAVSGGESAVPQDHLSQHGPLRLRGLQLHGEEHVHEGQARWGFQRGRRLVFTTTTTSFSAYIPNIRGGRKIYRPLFSQLSLCRFFIVAS